MIAWRRKMYIRRRIVAVVARVGCAACVIACGDSASDDDGDSTSAGSDSGTATTTATTAPTTGDDVGTSAGTATSGVDDSSSGSSGGPPAASWTTSLEVDETVGVFLSVWGDGAAPLYVVGGQTQPDQLTVGAMYRYDGVAWASEMLPSSTFTLNWVFGVEDRRMAVGDFGEILMRDGDDGTWTELSCMTTLPLWGVWGAAADDLWIVGGDGFDRDPILCHFDGVDVTQAVLPEPTFETHALFKVWGTSADDVYAVGDNGWIVHYDGVEWTEQASGTTSDLISLWGTGPEEILAVGGRASGVIARFDGTGWTATDQPKLPGLNGIFMDDDGTATVVGALGLAGRVAAGGSVVEVEPTGTQLTLHAVFGPPDDELYAVGGSLDQAPPYVGIVLTRPR